MTTGKQRWRITETDEPSLGGSLYWDRWARRLALAAGGANATTADTAVGDFTTASTSVAQACCIRHQVTANLERLIEELNEEAERVNEQAAELLLTEVV